MKNTEDFFEEDKIDLVNYFLVVLKRKKMFAFVVLVVFLLSVFYCLSLPKIYESQTIVLPKGDTAKPGLSSLIGGALGGLGGASAGGGTSSKMKLYLKSQSFSYKVAISGDVKAKYIEYLLKNKLVDKNDVASITDEDIGSNINSMIKYEDDVSLGSMSLTVRSRDAYFSQYLLTQIVDQLNKVLDASNAYDSTRSLDVVGRQLVQNRKELLELSKWLTQYYSHNSESSLKSEIDVPIGLSEESIMVHGDTTLNQGGSVNDVVMKEIPLQVYLKYIQQQSDILSNINKMLSQEYRMAIVNSVRDMDSFKVIDKPNLQLSPVKPILKYMMVISFVFALLVGVFVIFSMEYITNTRQKLKGIGQ